MRKRLLAIMLAVGILFSSLPAAIMGIADEVLTTTGEPTFTPTIAPDTNDAVETESAAAEDEPGHAEPTAEVSVTATAEPTVRTDSIPTASPTVAPTKTAEVTVKPTAASAPLQISLTCDRRYAHANQISIEMTLTIAGGAADYNVTWQVESGDETVSTENIVLTREGEFAYDYMPTAGGDYTVRATVVDGAGNRAEAFAVMPVAADDHENFDHWEKKLKGLELTGNWREDLLAVAGTQIGYRESYADFCIDEDGNVQGATLYGYWYRSPYGEWCGMFISWCLYQAGISEEDFPYEANCLKWKKALEKLDAYEAADGEYEPIPGDLVFFNFEDGEKPKHVGIVELVEDGKLYTIEGNSYKRVERKEYELDDACIVGYACMETLMLRAEVLPTVEPTVEPTIDTVEPTTEPTVEPTIDAADPTTKPTSVSNAGPEEISVTGTVKAVAVLTDTDSRLRVHAEACMDGETVEALRHNEEVTVLAVKGDWLKVVTKEDVTGYVAASHMKVTEGELPTTSDIAATDEPSDSAAPSDEATVYYCGLEEHTHGETCGEECALTEHVHDESCETEPVYYCGIEEHAHGTECFNSEGILWCGMPEHCHTDACLNDQPTVWYCGYEEHIHCPECFDESSALICTISEHQHSEACRIEPVYYCGLDEHAHTEECFSDDELVCGLSEHAHDASCLIAGLNIQLSAESVKLKPGEDFPQISVNARLTGATLPVNVTFGVEAVRETRVEAAVAVVEMEDASMEAAGGSGDSEVEVNVIAVGDLRTLTAETDVVAIAFTPDAYGVYRITVSADDATGAVAEASVVVSVSLDATEAVEVWEASMADVALTGDKRIDVPAVACSQLGYTESNVNFVIGADGEVCGYTRYGEWYGSPYADWRAIFASFCLNLAGLDDIPCGADCAGWVDMLAEAGMYRTADTYFPLPGDLVFFDLDGDGAADHVGIVEKNDYDLNAVEFTITTIEGDVDNTVARRTYEFSSAESIIGYGQICENEMQAEIDAVVAAIDALPDPNEAVEYLSTLEEAEDYDAIELYYKQYGRMAYDAYFDYQLLDVCLKGFVYNYEKLANLEWLWSYSLLLNGIVSDKPTPVDSVSTSEFVEINLYDYGSNINEKYKSNNKYPGFQWNGGAYMMNSGYNRHKIDFIDFGNSKITDFDYSGSDNGPRNPSMVVANKGGKINALDISSYGVTNRPIGMSTGDEVLQRTLGSDDYPALADGTSLAYLFTSGTYAQKQNTAPIDGLFRQNPTTGAYYYNSRWNHAQYGDNRFTLYNQIITPNFITYPFGNFLPLNDITNGANATQVSRITSVGIYVDGVITDLQNNPGTTENQLIDMLVKYRGNLKSVSTGQNSSAWDTWSAKDAINDYFTSSSGDNPSDDTSLISNDLLNKMYNIDWDVDTNFFFGMDISMRFVQPKNGKTGNDSNNDGKPDYDMEFYFTGDDDVWVYIDGVLFMDLSGIHRHVGGKIDFVEGRVEYYYLDTENTGDVSDTPYKTFTFAEILTKAGRDTSGLNAKGAFRDYTVHDFNFYYMERGSGSSVCRINFNFPMLKKNSISVSKELTSDIETIGNPDFKFQVLKANGTELTEELFIGAGAEYTIYDQNDNRIGTGVTDENGVFALKAGQRAEFGGIRENSGKYYVRELLEGTVLEQYGQITVSGSSTTTSGNVTVGSASFTGVNSPIRDASDGSTAFRFDNGVNERKLGAIEFGKTVTDYPDGAQVDTDREFTFQVTLDGELLPVGTEYTVDGESRSVATAGVITLKVGQQAVISSILAGTSYRIEETDYANYDPVWTVVSDEYGTQIVESAVVTGVIAVDVTASFTCTNAELGTFVKLPVTKNVANPDGQKHAFSFSITEVDEDGNAKSPSTDKTIAMTGNTETAELFELYYPATSLQIGENIFYYRIAELDADGVDCDDSVYYVKVTVFKEENGECSAAYSVYMNSPDGNAASAIEFTNTLLTDLSVSKTVEGGGAETAATEFSFAATLSDGSAPVSGTFETVLKQAGADDVKGTITFDQSGRATFTLSHGQKLTIIGVPSGVIWNVTETDYNGFTPYVNGSQTDTTGDVVAGPDGNEAAFVNKTTFRFPETGGSGTLRYAGVGALLLAAAGLALYNNRKRDRRGGQL